MILFNYVFDGTMNQDKTIRDRIKRWYEGKYIPWENEPDSPIVVIGGDTKYHWTAIVARVVVGFWLRHWKWCLGFSVSVAIAVLMYLQ